MELKTKNAKTLVEYVLAFFLVPRAGTKPH